MTATLFRLLARHRRGVVLGSALLLAFVALSLQARQDVAVVVVAKRGLLMTVAPFIRATAWTGGAVHAVWRQYVDLRGVQAENRRLHRERVIDSLWPDLTVEDGLAIQRQVLPLRAYSPFFISGAQLKFGDARHSTQIGRPVIAARQRLRRSPCKSAGQRIRSQR